MAIGINDLDDDDYDIDGSVYLMILFHQNYLKN